VTSGCGRVLLVLIAGVAMWASSPRRCTAAEAATAPTTRAALAADSIERSAIRRGAAASATQPSAAAANTAPPRGAGQSLSMQRLALSLGIVIVVIIAARVVMRKMFPAATVGRSSQVIRVLSRSVLAPKQQFLLLQVGKRLIVVGDSGASMNALAEITDPQEVASLVGQLASESASSSSSAFGAIFGRASNEFTPADETPAHENSEEPSAGGVAPSTEPNIEPPDMRLAAASAEIGSLLERARGLVRNVKRS
jgi:flagellar biogenesis protein FliO